MASHLKEVIHLLALQSFTSPCRLKKAFEFHEAALTLPTQGCKHVGTNASALTGPTTRCRLKVGNGGGVRRGNARLLLRLALSPGPHGRGFMRRLPTSGGSKSTEGRESLPGGVAPQGDPSSYLCSPPHCPKTEGRLGPKWATANGQTKQHRRKRSVAYCPDCNQCRTCLRKNRRNCKATDPNQREALGGTMAHDWMKKTDRT